VIVFNEILSFLYSSSFHFSLHSVDSDGNVIFELNKPEIDDAHKDKQKMFSENFKVSIIVVVVEDITMNAVIESSFDFMSIISNLIKYSNFFFFSPLHH
jgi:hypothetical protein